MLTSQAHSKEVGLCANAATLGPTLTRCGEYWTVQFHGRSVCVRHCKGIEDLARLISGPQEGLHVLELFQDASARNHVPYGAASAQTDGLRIVGREVLWEERLDARARGAYRARYLQLTEALEQARERNDAGQVERCHEELEQLLAALKQRRFVSCPTAERARKAVYNRLHSAIRRLERLDRELSSHLRRAIRTGSYCCYRPEPLQCVTCTGGTRNTAALE